LAWLPQNLVPGFPDDKAYKKWLKANDVEPRRARKRGAKDARGKLELDDLQLDGLGKTGKKACKNLEMLAFTCFDVKDLSGIELCPNLERIWFNGGFNTANLKPLAKLKKLRDFDIGGPLTHRDIRPSSSCLL
jgi:hypothetical protein